MFRSTVLAADRRTQGSDVSASPTLLLLGDAGLAQVVERVICNHGVGGFESLQSAPIFYNAEPQSYCRMETATVPQ
jgi:hypothetical protein